uniref:Uncharacterized protein n=1 Tax=Rheinheimera sp. BAL341 TaxID=1708203 RepID=A0A486XNQ9_9GAMM
MLYNIKPELSGVAVSSGIPVAISSQFGADFYTKSILD